MDIILASQSPRRRELLERMGLPFRIITPDIDEHMDRDLPPAELVRQISLEKAQAGSGVRQEESLAGASLADCVILPLPAEGEGGVLNAPLSDSRCTLEMVFDALQPGQVVCAGKVTPRALALAA